MHLLYRRRRLRLSGSDATAASGQLLSFSLSLYDCGSKKMFPLVSSSIPFLLCLPRRSLPPLVNCPNIPVIGCLCLLDSSLGSVHPGPDTSSEDCVSLSCRRTLRALSRARAPSLLSVYLPLSLYHSLSLSPSAITHTDPPTNQPLPSSLRSHYFLYKSEAIYKGGKKNSLLVFEKLNTGENSQRLENGPRKKKEKMFFLSKICCRGKTVGRASNTRSVSLRLGNRQIRNQGPTLGQFASLKIKLTQQSQFASIKITTAAARVGKNFFRLHSLLDWTTLIFEWQ
jgi:hypothetical protein